VKHVEFNASCKYEVGDRVNGSTITDIAAIHYVVSGRVEFRYLLDDSMWVSILNDTSTAPECGDAN
jgi:hypothetical protein